MLVFLCLLFSNVKCAGVTKSTPKMAFILICLALFGEIITFPSAVKSC